MNDLMKAFEEYISFLDNESNKYVQFAGIHGMKVPDEVFKKGEELRNKIFLAKAALKEDGWVELNNIVINELPNDSVVLTMMNNRRVFVYDYEHGLKGLAEIQKHHPEVLCLIITKPLPQPPTK